MDLLNVLKQLRDDIKIWVTNNLNALNTKIDEKTILVDSQLDSSSTNPVQNKAIASEIEDINNRVGDTSVAIQISNAIAKQPHFSGDYNDLVNTPNITEDDSGNMVITDGSGNIIFRADADGIHTTTLSLNGESAATEKYVDDAIANIDIPKVDFTGYATEEYVDNAIDAIKFPETDLSDYYNKEETDTIINTTKEELSESIVAESDEWKVVDEAGNIIFSVDASGAHTTELTLNGESAATKSYVDEAIANIDFHETDISGKADVEHKHVIEDITDFPTNLVTIDDVNNAIADFIEADPVALEALQELSQALENHEDAYDALLETVGSKATKTELEEVKAEISESIVSETDEFHIVDEDGNIVASIDENGVSTTTVTARSVIVNGNHVEEHIDNTEIHVTAAEKESWSTKSNFSGKYGDLTDKPTLFSGSYNDLTDKPAATDLSNYYTKAETNTVIEELSESIVSDTDEFHIVDDVGNIVATIDAGGISTTTVAAQNIMINGLDLEDLIHARVQAHVDEAILGGAW